MLAMYLSYELSLRVRSSWDKKAIVTYYLTGLNTRNSRQPAFLLNFSSDCC